MNASPYYLSPDGKPMAQDASDNVDSTLAKHRAARDTLKALMARPGGT